MKTRTPANNARSDRRRRAMKIVEEKLALKDAELTKRNPAKDVKVYREELKVHLGHLVKIQATKGGTL